jgi:putative glutamine amidotransferase
MSTRLPKIAISTVPRTVMTGYGLDRADTVAAGSIRGVVAAGGVPVLLPVVAPERAVEQIAAFDGLILSGGHDLAVPLDDVADDERWIDRERDAHELALWNAASSARIPVLGICRGAQLVSHALGGILAAQIDGHDAAEAHSDHMHAVEIEAASRLAEACGSGTHDVNTIHHQAVSVPGDGLVVSARSADGSIEGVESSAEMPWFVGVQWHPELMAGSPAGDGLFEALVARA